MRALGASSSRSVVLTRRLRVRLPRPHDRLCAARLPEKADGSLIELDGKVVGSRLAAQAFTEPQYFHPRPSARSTTTPRRRASRTSDRRTPSSRRPSSERAPAILELEGPYNPGLEIGDIPVDAVTTSGSGIDPHISPAYAQLQARAHRRRPRPAARARRGADRRRDRRPLPRLLRRARRQRARAEPRARQETA